MAMDTSNKSLTSLLEKMVAADTDYRFMAMNDLINELQVNTLRLDLQSEKRVVGLILRLLRDPSGEVQSLAVKSLGPLATKVKEQQIITIVKDLVGTMEKGGEGQLRSICSIGLKTVVNALPNATDMVVVQSAVREAISPLLHMVMSHQDDNVRVEACEVLAEIINHFGNLLTSYHLDLLDCMITCLGCPQTTLRKRAIQALGYLSWIIPQKYFSSLVSFLLFRLQMSPFLTSKPMEKFDDHLSKLITENTLFQRPHLLEQLKQVPSVDVMKTLLQCFNVVSRQLQRSPHCIPSVLQLLISIAYSSNTNNPEQDDIVELVIQVLETIIRRCPRAISPSLPELINLLCERLQYDPNYDYGLVEDGDDQMGVNNNYVDFEDDNADVDADDDEDGEYSDDEDVSWKVRRAAARGLEAIILVFTEMTANFYVSIAPLLIKQFNEREESVRLSIFSCLSALLRQTRLTSTIHLNTTITNGSVAVNQQNSPRSYESTLFVSESTLEELKLHLQDPNSAQSRLLSLLPTLYRGIEKQTSQSISNKMKSQNANRVLSVYRHTAFMLNRDLALALPGQLGAHLNNILMMIKISSDDPNTNHTAKMEMINVLVLLLSTHPASYFESKLDLLVQLTVQSINNSFYRVALEGLDLLQLLCTHLKSLGGEKYAQVLFTPLFNQLKATDRDLELKEKAITVTAVFLSQIGYMVESNINDCLDLIYRRLTNELTRLAAVRAIQIIASSPLQLDLLKFLPGSSHELGTFLSKNDRNLRMITLRCLYTILLKYPNSLDDNCIMTILNLMPKLLITEHDLQTSQLALHLTSLFLESPNPLASQVFQIVIQEPFLECLINLAHSPLLRGQALDGMLRLMRAFGHLKKTDPNGRQQLTLFLSRLLDPIENNHINNNTSLFGHNSAINSSNNINNTTPNRTSSIHRDALPSLAQCMAALLAELPMTSSNSPSLSSSHFDGLLSSVNNVVDQLLISVKDPSTSPTQLYLNLLILGELGRKVDLSSRTDLRDLLISCLSSTNNSPYYQQTPHTPTGLSHSTISSNGFMVSEEVKPAAALSLGRMVVGKPEILLPPLIESISQAVKHHMQLTNTSGSFTSSIGASSGSKNNTSQHQLYYLIQALREVLVNLAGLDPNQSLKHYLDSMWSLLLACSGLSEEGTRNLVSECLGRLTLVDPPQLVGRLRQQLNSPEASSSVLMRSTLVTAVKFILIVTDLDAGTMTKYTGRMRYDLPDVTYFTVPSQETPMPSSPVTNDIESALRAGSPPALIDFLGRLADQELSVRRAALVALNTVAHHRPGLVRPLLNIPIQLPGSSETSTLLDMLCAETVIRKELIREVEMGPFKHHEDDGLDLRKCAFECMSTLLETCLDKLVIPNFLESLIDGLRDHTDIKLLSYQILQRISIIRPMEISAKMEILAVPLKAVLFSKPKDDWVKQEMEKMQELNRSAIGLIVSLRNIDDIDKNRHYVELIRIINADSNLKNIYMQILSTENYSTKNNLSTLTTTQTTGEYGRNTSSSCSLTGDGSGGVGFIGKFSSTRS
ncbi:Cullin-associated NEDD8-dissociated protein 1 [Schistosoma haematobium]|uniref:Cullin-associated NEDD8-dissociated protein 1 n=2 Tax=Schistosoma haematobium TaxID=6185 RepID=A0A922II51_SCHHA|nr:Cullin-associated NEDD8-dissociated protein 1 [Schistosoma haematobium]KAH9579592.1 Cullin-associated NEDD8-dissociated protein 1 [Schistosoma haematobium]